MPVTSFFEWQEQPHGRKQAFEIRRENWEWMWVAGIYEESEKHGLCYSTITTEPPDWMVSIHDRMLAILELDQAFAFLYGEFLPDSPYGGELVAGPCESPLKTKSGANSDGDQGELF